jgi:hypothetical protein
VDSADLPLNVSREILQESATSRRSARAAPSACCRCWRTWPKTSRRRTRPSGRSSVRCSRRASVRTSATRSASPSCCASPQHVGARRTDGVARANTCRGSRKVRTRSTT